MTISRKMIVERPNYDLEFVKEQTNREGEKRLFIKGQYIMMNRSNKNNRIYEESQMIPAVETYIKDYIKENRGGGELNHCVPDHYKILTDVGWKKLSDISDTEVVATLNTESGEIEYSQIKEKINNPYKGEMINIKGRNINLLATPNHRVLIRTRTGKYVYKTAEEIYDERDSSVICHSALPKTGDWTVKSPETFTLKGVPNVKKLGNYNNDITKDIVIDYNLYVSFLGLYLAEGHCVKGGRHYGVHITQIKDKFMAEIADLLARFPEELKWHKDSKGFVCSDRRLNEHLMSLGNCYNKFIPLDVKQNSSADDLTDLIYWFNVGDGRFNLIQDKYPVRNVFTVSNQLIDDLNECLFKSGLLGNISVLAQKDSVIRGRQILAENTKPLFLLNLSKTQGVHLDTRFIDIVKTEFDGNVGCVVTENTNWYCMDDSGKTYWTGNSASPDVDLTKLADKIVSLERDEHDSDYYIGKSMILSTPSGKILESLVHDNVKFGKSTKCLGQIAESGDGYNRVNSPIVLLVDNVFDPSVATAFVNGILENKEYIIADDGKVAEAYAGLEKKLSKFPGKHRDAINQYIQESLQKFLQTI